MPEQGRIHPVLALGLCNIPLPELGWCQVILCLLATISAPSQFQHCGYFCSQCWHWANSSLFWQRAKMGTQCWHWVLHSWTGCLTLILNLNGHTMVVPQREQTRPVPDWGLCNIPMLALGFCQVGERHLQCIIVVVPQPCNNCQIGDQTYCWYVLTPCSDRVVMISFLHAFAVSAGPLIDDLWRNRGKGRFLVYLPAQEPEQKQTNPGYSCQW